MDFQCSRRDWAVPREGCPHGKPWQGWYPPLENWKGADCSTYSRRIGKSRKIFLHSQDILFTWLTFSPPLFFLSLFFFLSISPFLPSPLPPSLSLSRLANILCNVSLFLSSARDDLNTLLCWATVSVASQPDVNWSSRQLWSAVGSGRVGRAARWKLLVPGQTLVERSVSAVQLGSFC